MISGQLGFSGEPESNQEAWERLQAAATGDTITPPTLTIQPADTEKLEADSQQLTTQERR